MDFQASQRVSDFVSQLGKSQVLKWIFMKNIILFFCLFIFLSIQVKAQLSGAELLEKSIQYHDPKNNWEGFKQTLDFEQTRPDGSISKVKVFMNNEAGQFWFYQDRDTLTKKYEITGDTCRLELNGSESISKDEAEKHRMNCKTARLYRNYYTYLWGLPMKLTDPGTIVHSKVEEETFQNVGCYKLKITYEESVGNDTWYFYFKKSNYALHAYKFYHDESANDGEYITLEGEEIFSKIKFPKTRKWYYNKDDKFLGTDMLLK